MSLRGRVPLYKHSRITTLGKFETTGSLNRYSGCFLRRIHGESENVGCQRKTINDVVRTPPFLDGKSLLFYMSRSVLLKYRHRQTEAGVDHSPKKILTNSSDVVIVFGILNSFKYRADSPYELNWFAAE